MRRELITEVDAKVLLLSAEELRLLGVGQDENEATVDVQIVGKMMLISPLDLSTRERWVALETALMLVEDEEVLGRLAE